MIVPQILFSCWKLPRGFFLWSHDLCYKQSCESEKKCKNARPQESVIEMLWFQTFSQFTPMES